MHRGVGWDKFWWSDTIWCWPTLIKQLEPNKLRYETRTMIIKDMQDYKGHQQSRFNLFFKVGQPLISKSNQNYHQFNREGIKRETLLIVTELCCPLISTPNCHL